MAVAPVQRLLQAQAGLRADLAANPDLQRWGEVAFSGLPWQPVIDGDIIPAPPIDRIVSGAAADIDLMTGTNTDEFRLFLVPNGIINYITPEILKVASPLMVSL